MVPENLQVLSKFGFCSICSQNLDEYSLARARKIFAIARILGFLLKDLLDCSKVRKLFFCMFYGTCTEINPFLKADLHDRKFLARLG